MSQRVRYRRFALVPGHDDHNAMQVGMPDGYGSVVAWLPSAEHNALAVVLTDDGDFATFIPQLIRASGARPMFETPATMPPYAELVDTVCCEVGWRNVAAHWGLLEDTPAEETVEAPDGD